MAKLEDLSGAEAVLALIMAAIFLPFIYALAVAILMVPVAAAFWCLNTICGCVVVALTWTNVFAGAVLLSLFNVFIRRKAAK